MAVGIAHPPTSQCLVDAEKGDSFHDEDSMSAHPASTVGHGFEKNKVTSLDSIVFSDSAGPVRGSTYRYPCKEVVYSKKKMM